MWVADPATTTQVILAQSAHDIADSAADPSETDGLSGSGGGGPPAVTLTTTTEDDRAGNSALQEAPGAEDSDGPLPGHWVNAIDLKTGSLLRTSAGTWIQITAVETRTEHTTVYNLTVADIHTYHVAANNTDFLTHNDDPCSHLDTSAIPEDAQPYVENVVRQMDSDGTPPTGVRQGGSSEGQGIYSGEGLPQKPAKYWVETDVFPTMPGQTRPDGRLVFGVAGEVYYSRHYDGFTLLRGPSCGCW